MMSLGTIVLFAAALLCLWAADPLLDLIHAARAAEREGRARYRAELVEAALRAAQLDAWRRAHVRVMRVRDRRLALTLDREN